MVVALDGAWRLTTDPRNVGRDERWFAQPLADAVPTRVPWVIQQAFPGYHGVAWYQREFAAPAHPLAGGRYLLRFWAVDYLAEVWLNDTRLGGHEGGETPFVLDATAAVRPDGPNRLTVRVLNPTNEPIDGFVLRETPARNKVIPYTAGNSYNHGGLVDSVELLLAPPVRLADLCLRPDPDTGVIGVRVEVTSNLPVATRRRIEVSVAPATAGETVAWTTIDRDVPPGESVTELSLRVAQPHRWDLNDPYLYRVTARLSDNDGSAGDELSARCGFRDFRFERGAFRLNGRRLFLKCSHTGNHCPIGLQFPHDPDLLRRDLLNVKVMGFNAIRFIAGLATRQQLDLCDELGLLVYEEPYSAWLLAASPHLAERFDRSMDEMIRRDRNHASVVIWGLLNETKDGPVFRHAVDCLPLVRGLDPTRLVVLNSGRWDQQTTGEAAIGSLSNPGSDVWEDVLDDEHPYQRVPHTAEVIRFLRTAGAEPRPLFISEYGVGSAVDLCRVARWYEQLGATAVEDARFYRDQLDRFLADWQRWRLDECFARPEDFFLASQRQMAADRLDGLNALRANPRLVAHSVTGTVDQGMSGEGLFTTFRELKPGTTDALFEAWAPLRLCLFAEPLQVYRGGQVRLEAVLANEDALPPGDYPVRITVVGPGLERLLQRTVTVTVLAGEPPFALPFLAEDLTLDGPAGEYRFLATFERGGAATGGEARFQVFDPATMPRVEAPVTLWGDDPQLADWLDQHGVTRRPPGAAPAAREVILVGRQGSPGVAAWRDLAERLARGSTAVFLSPEAFRRGEAPLGWLPLTNRGTLANQRGWLYHKDAWAKRHPIFDGLPAGGLLDHRPYRELIPDLVFCGQDPPLEAVAGACNASLAYASGLLTAVFPLGAGRLVINALQIRPNLDTNPVADRLLLNLLGYAGRDLGQPLVALTGEAAALVRALGYE